MHTNSQDVLASMEANVSAIGQVTLPKELRTRLGLQAGGRIRFSMASGNEARIEPVRYTIHEIWRLADEGGKAEGTMSFEEMDTAKASHRHE